MSRMIYGFDGTIFEGQAGIRRPVFRKIDSEIEGFVTPFENPFREQEGNLLVVRHTDFLSEVIPWMTPFKISKELPVEVWYLSKDKIENLIHELVKFSILKSLALLKQKDFKSSARYARQGLMIVDCRSNGYKKLYSLLLRNPQQDSLIEREIEVLCPDSSEEVFRLAHV